MKGQLSIIDNIATLSEEQQGKLISKISNCFDEFFNMGISEKFDLYLQLNEIFIKDEEEK